MSSRVSVDGKFFALDGSRFAFHGVSYGTFRPRAEDGARFPTRDVIKRDFSRMRESGFTVVRTYTPPPEDLLELAADWGLHVLAGVFYPDWRYLVGVSRQERSRLERAAQDEVRSVARRLAGDERVLGLSLGNEIPADVIRWFGTRHVADAIADLVTVVREEDPEQLVTYGNYPTAEYLPLPDLDFLTFNVFLETQPEFRAYLTRLHHLAGDRPLVLGELGLDAGGTPDGEQRQAEVLDWQLETTVERGVAGTSVFSWTDEWWVGDAAVEGWHFGLTRHDRSPRPALEVATRWNGRTVRDLDFPWPSMTVAVCAYNAAATLEECLQATCALDYPALEVLVVDDGSEDATAEIARRHPRARLVQIEHAGLSVGRNTAFQAATGDLVVYLDSDAYPSPEWPFFIALAFDAPTVGGAGGPNIPPRHDPVSAQAVSRAPGGPVHVLLTDDRAEHVPGCNMAFWKDVLTEVGGFDPVYTSAGDDVDLCWKVLDRRWEIGFHPAALVWHHRRAGLRPYLRQQRGYGRSEALVEARHPARFTPTGSARWHGRIYDSFAPAVTRQRVYHGAFGAAAYQSVYQGGGYALDLAHQVGMPLAVAVLLTAPLGLLHVALAVPALAAVGFVLVLAGIDVSRARAPRQLRSTLSFRLHVMAMHLLQPLVRAVSRSQHRTLARSELPAVAALPSPVTTLPGGVLLMPADRPRADLAALVVGRLRQDGVRVLPASGWEAYDARTRCSFVLDGDVLTSNHPADSVQLRIRGALRWRRLAMLAVLAVGVALLVPALGLLVAAVAAANLGLGALRIRSSVRRLSRAGGVAPA